MEKLKDILKEKFQTTPSQKTMIITRPLRGNLARLVDVFSKTYECRQLAFEALDDTNFKIVMESMTAMYLQQKKRIYWH